MSYEEIWFEDVLGRKDDVLYLSKYIVNRFHKKSVEPGFVLAINAEWGFGKSFMLSRWKAQAEFEGHPAIFFDAWQSDFTTDPLLAFIAELDSGLQKYFNELSVGKKLSRAAVNAIKKTWKPILMVLGSAVLKHAAGISFAQLSKVGDGDSDKEELDEKAFDAEGLQKNLKEAVEKALKTHNNIKQAIAEFRRKLAGLIEILEESSGIQLPLMIFIDELDRCRPDYAIELLEGIKHLFGVPGVYFIIATNVKQLGESVKAIYGSGFDGQKYLKRFFDLQYALREPDNEQFAAALFSEMPLPIADNIIYGLARAQTTGQQSVVEHIPYKIFSYILCKHADAFGLGLRDMGQIFTVIESCLITLNHRPVHPFFLIFLAIIFHKDHELFLRISRSHKLPSLDHMSELGYRSELAKIEFRYFDDDGRNQRKSVELYEIASFYLSMFKPDTYNHHIRSGGYIFPDNLVNGNTERSIDGKFKLEFSDYFSLVKHGGSFAI